MMPLHPFQQLDIDRIKYALSLLQESFDKVNPFLEVTGLDDPKRVEKFHARGALEASKSNAKSLLSRQLQSAQAANSTFSVTSILLLFHLAQANQGADNA